MDSAKDKQLGNEQTVTNAMLNDNQNIKKIMPDGEEPETSEPRIIYADIKTQTFHIVDATQTIREKYKQKWDEMVKADDLFQLEQPDISLKNKRGYYRKFAILVGILIIVLLILVVTLISCASYMRNTNTVTMLSGAIGGFTTTVLGVVAFGQNLVHKKESERLKKTELASSDSKDIATACTTFENTATEFVFYVQKHANNDTIWQYQLRMAVLSGQVSSAIDCAAFLSKELKTYLDEKLAQAVFMISEGGELLVDFNNKQDMVKQILGKIPDEQAKYDVPNQLVAGCDKVYKAAIKSQTITFILAKCSELIRSAYEKEYSITQLDELNKKLLNFAKNEISKAEAVTLDKSAILPVKLWKNEQ